MEPHNINTNTFSNNPKHRGRSDKGFSSNSQTIDTHYSQSTPATNNFDKNFDNSNSSYNPAKRTQVNSSHSCNQGTSTREIINYDEVIFDENIFSQEVINLEKGCTDVITQPEKKSNEKLPRKTSISFITETTPQIDPTHDFKTAGNVFSQEAVNIEDQCTDVLQLRTNSNEKIRRKTSISFITETTSQLQPAHDFKSAEKIFFQEVINNEDQSIDVVIHPKNRITEEISSNTSINFKSETTCQLQPALNSKPVESIFSEVAGSVIESKPPKPLETLTISGIPIFFPFKPYPAQVQLMTKVVKAIQSSQNALLESPTGTGKTLSLLCSALGWQSEEKKRRTQIFQKLNEACLDTQEPNLTYTATQPTYSSTDPPTSEVPFDFAKPPDLPDIDPTTTLDNKLIMPALAKIYYCTRTHKQVSQVVEELRAKCSYLPKVSILGSRSRYCIHPKAKSSSDLDTECSKLRKTTSLLEKNSFQEISKNLVEMKMLAKGGVPTKDFVKFNESFCAYYSNKEELRSSIKNSAVLGHLRRSNNRPHFDSPIWDIEDLVLAGKEHIGCPYYVSKELAERAELIFCPYNYVIYPSIRKACNISLKNNIFIIDEAHNIENSSREAAGMEIQISSLASLSKQLKLLVNYGSLGLFANYIKVYLDTVIDLACNHFIPQDEETMTCDPQSMWGFFATRGFHPSCLPEIHSMINHLKKKLDEHTEEPELYSSINSFEKKLDEHTKEPEMHSSIFPFKRNLDGHIENPEIPTAPSLTISQTQILDSLFGTLSLVYDHPQAFMIARISQPQVFSWEPSPVSLGFWCLDSGVAFKEISQEARSVILASGTMSPLGTFSSELNTDFDHKLEGRHVIKSDQVWTGVIPMGPNGHRFDGVFQTRETSEYQDDLGLAIANIISNVPNGVICFASSYNYLDQLLARWRFTGTWNLINSQKEILVEPREAGLEFDQVTAKYKILTRKGSEGAIIFAVFRGKLSEGIDFKDEECRCVISIGIPFSYFGDPLIKLKKSFNDLHRSSRGLMSGSTWYRTDAYRAINQALGRCIRHRHDWGAIVLLEQRFSFRSHTSQLSQWIRESLTSYRNFNSGLTSLAGFMEKWKA